MMAVAALPGNRAITLLNENCPYCLRLLGSGLVPTKEHVIARKLVPKGTLQGSWNLILRACKQCNAAKATLEDDISAITMQPDATGRYASHDPRLIAEAQRKAQGSISRLTQRRIEQSNQGFQVERSHGPMTYTFSFTAPSIADDSRIFGLAEYQMQAFFYWSFYQQDIAKGTRWVGQFMPVQYTRRGDWGNPVNRWFMQEINGWQHRILAIGADGFFRVLLCRHPDNHPLWGWALEWNQNFRVIGFCGDLSSADTVTASMPKLDMQLLHEVPGQFLRYYRIEQALDPAEDDLFTYPPSDAGRNGS
jgi:hypothetical protein